MSVDYLAMINHTIQLSGWYYKT